ncbi:MAG: DegT/DnrJ/EryC1/StrS family aminotransferase [Geobacter sp.]|nr:DegT/DnrJ/EryC1/StrS family aminotransferase [Geobacter sp.]
MPHKISVPMTNLSAQYVAQETEIMSAIGRVLKSGWYILGREVTAFEEEFAAYCGVEHCIGVASGTDAVALALKSCGVKAGHEVITVSHTAVATVAAIEQIGAVPVFTDIAPATRCMNPECVSALVSEKTKAVVPVHIYGQPAPMDELVELAERHDLVVIEDCAQAHGAEIDGRKVGSFGNAAAFSFYPTKNLGALGDGGAVVCNSNQIADQCRWLRQYGWKERYISEFPGLNSRLDELQAAVLRVRLANLDAGNARRREIARRYDQALVHSEIVTPAYVSGTLHAMHLYVVETDERDELAQFLASYGISTGRHYPLPVHLQPAYRGRIRGGDHLPITEKLYDCMLTLPMYPELEDVQVEQVCYALEMFSNAADRRQA